jgi:hypothetical protein
MVKKPIKIDTISRVLHFEKWTKIFKMQTFSLYDNKAEPKIIYWCSFISAEIKLGPVMVTTEWTARESLLKGKDQYDSPPWINSSNQLFIILKNNIYLFLKKCHHNKEVKCTEPSPSVRVPWNNHHRTALYCFCHLKAFLFFL